MMLERILKIIGRAARLGIVGGSAQPGQPVSVREDRSNMRSSGAFIRGFSLGAIASLWLCVGTGNVLAQAPQGKTFDDWTVKCDAPKDKTNGQCFVVQVIRHTRNDKVQMFFTAVFGRFGDKAEPGAIFTLPLGVYLPAGLSVAIDGKELRNNIAFETCESGGCRVKFGFDEKTLEAFRKGLSATATFFDLRRRRISVALSLRGFSRAIATIPAKK